MGLDASRDELLGVLATFGLTAVTEATPSQVAVEALVLPCRKPLPQRFAGTRGRVNAAPLGCSPRGWEITGSVGRISGPRANSPAVAKDRQVVSEQRDEPVVSGH